MDQNFNCYEPVDGSYPPGKIMNDYMYYSDFLEAWVLNVNHLMGEDPEGLYWYAVARGLIEDDC